MSERDWHAPGGAALAAPRPAEAGAAPERAPDAPFPAFASHHHRELLAQAHARGLLHMLQAFPPPANGTADHGKAPVPRLEDVLAGNAPPLPPAAFAEPVELLDPALDPVQLDAVARALQTPDLFLIRGLPGAGKKRVAAELVRQAVARGRRVLLVAPPPTIDAVLGQLSSCAGLVPLRCLGPGETADGLTASSAPLTLARREAAIAAEVRARAADESARAEAAARSVRELRPDWEALHRLAEPYPELAVRLDETRRRRAEAPDAVRRPRADGEPDGSAFCTALQAHSQGHVERLAGLSDVAVELQKQRAEAEQRLGTAAAELDALRPKAEARRRGRFWTADFWCADRTLPGRVAELEAGLAAAEAALAEVARRERDAGSASEQAEAQYRDTRRALIDDEATRVVTDLLVVESSLLTEQAALNGRAAPHRDRIAAAGVEGPSTLSPAAVRDAEARAAEALARREREADFARQWSAFAEAEAPAIAAHFRGSVNLAAGPAGCVDHDTFFAHAGRFDLLLAADAHLLRDEDLLTSARRAERWVLIGEPAEVPCPEDTAPRRAAHSVARRAPDLFARLTDRLHHDRWAVERGRLWCRLHPVAPAERRHLERESLADNPEIELHIFTPPGGEPSLAEIAFPSGWGPARARDYVLRELGEYTPQPRCRTARWSEEAGALCVRFEPGEPPERLAVGEGVTEWLSGPRTVGFAFDAARWDRPRAEAWVHEHLSRHDSGRTALLDAPYRTGPGVAAWMNGFLGVPYAVPHRQPAEPAVAFLPVPARSGRPASADENRRQGPPRQGGAGYEIDLADAAQRSKLSPALLKGLPARGFVNLPEADRVVQKLEELTQRLPPESIGVAAVYDAQAALIRSLAARTARLSAVWVAGPDGWANQDRETLVISLTRSHPTRAVTYGDEPDLPPRLFTRARGRLIVAGDAGSLARRARWEGACDHFDAAAAERERDWVAYLSACLRGEAGAGSLRVLDGDRA